MDNILERILGTQGDVNDCFLVGEQSNAGGRRAVVLA
jgi:hypothetical protein